MSIFHRRKRDARRQRKQSSPHRKLRFEKLESRRVLSTFTVTTLKGNNDTIDGELSLHEAIVQANDQAGADRIEFADTVRGEIGLSQPLPDLASDITIVGPDASDLAVRRVSGGDYGIFRVSTGAKVHVQGLAIVGGKAERGGGILNAGGDVTVIDSFFLENEASGMEGASGEQGIAGMGNTSAGGNGSAGEGGAIHNMSGSLSVSSTGFTRNRAVGGVGGTGGEGARSPICHTTSAPCEGGVGGVGGIGSGGAIFVSGGSVVVSESTFTENLSQGGTGGTGGTGGGRFEISIVDPQPGGDGGKGGSSRGGSIVVGGGTLEIMNSIIDRNRSLVGSGGEGGEGGCGRGTCGATGFAGPAGDLTEGGNFYVAGGGLTISDATNVSGGASLFGGGVYIAGGSVSVTDNSRISKNSATLGAGILNKSGVLAVRQSSITENVAGLSGGGIYAESGTATIESGSVISSNRATGGAGIFNMGANLTLIDSMVAGNEVLGAAGDPGPPANNGHGHTGRDASGGGIEHLDGDLTITRSTISGNKVTAGRGGSGGSATIAGDGGDGGRAAGAGVSISGGIARVIQSTISGNVAEGGSGGNGGFGGAGGFGGDGGLGGTALGGGINIANGTLTIIGSTIAQNTSRGGNGGGAGSPNGSTGRSGQGAGGGLNRSGGTVNVQSTLLANNTGPDGRDVLGTVSSLGFNLVGVRDGSSGFTHATDRSGTLASPLDAGLGSLRDNGGPTLTHSLLADSPAIDQGFSGGATIDQTRRTRTVDAAAANAPGGDGTDIGAFEVQVSATSGVEINVYSCNSQLIRNGDTTPDSTDCTLFGSVPQGQTGPEVIFVVTNTGTATAALEPVTVPEGFSVVDQLKPSLTPREADTFVVKLDTITAGVKSGSISFGTNDPDDDPYFFAIRGEVTAPNDANLSIVEAYFIDAAGTRLDNPPAGANVRVRTDFQSHALPANASYEISYGFQGETQRYTVGFGAGLAGTAGLVHVSDPWFVRGGNSPLNVGLDAAGAIAESSESDNAIVRAVSPIVFTPKFVTPIGGTPYEDWTIVNYVDADLDADLRSDYLGGPYVFDQHNGLDIGLANFLAMDRGISVHAAAAGRVIEVRDGNFDRQIVGDPNTDNFIYIDHGGGWVTRYHHLRRDSVQVAVGDDVRAGQQIGLVGSAGASSGPHLHFEVQYRGMLVEPFADPTGYWVDPFPYAAGQPGVLDGGVTNFAPSSQQFAERPSELNVFEQRSGLFVTGWTNIHGIDPGDVLAYEWLQPDGSQFNRETWNNVLITSGTWIRILQLPATPALGTWRFRVSVNGNVVFTDEFEVAATGTPEIELSSPDVKTKVRAVNGNVVEEDVYIVDGRSTPIDFGSVAAGSSGSELSFRVGNHGDRPLTTFQLQLPSGFSVTESIDSSIAPGASDTFTVRLDSNTPGSKAGLIRLVTDDVDESEFEFAVIGNVTGVAQSSIRGLVFDDPDGDGRDAGETGIPGRVVTLDSNRDGRLDDGDRTVVTSSTGSQVGEYSFGALSAGTYLVQVSEDDVWAPASPNAFIPVEDNLFLSPSNGYHSALSAAADDTKWLQLDLGRNHPIDQISLIPARPTDFTDTPGFGFPSRFRVDVSNDPDFTDSQTVVDYTNSDFANPGVNPVNFVGDALDDVSGRYVRITATRLWNRGDGYLFALAEVDVWSGDVNAARDASVTSRDSDESGRWGHARVVDGYSSRRQLNSTTGFAPQTVILAAGENAVNVDLGIRRTGGEGPFQIIRGAGSSVSGPIGGTATVGIEYSVSDNNTTLAGIGFRLHFDSTKLVYQAPANVFPTNLVTSGIPVSDSSNFDGDDATDRYVEFRWSDILNSEWPEAQLPHKLLDARFRIATGVTAGESTIHFSPIETSPGYEFQGRSIDVAITRANNLDVDGNGRALALSDGILVFRYLFGIRGPDLTNGIIAPDAIRRTPAEIVAHIDSMRDILDADGNGESLALSDGLLVFRYLFGIEGQDLIKEAVEPGATRTTPGAIASYLQQFLSPAESAPTQAPLVAAPAANARTATISQPAQVAAVHSEADRRQIIATDPAQITFSSLRDRISFDVVYTSDPLDATLAGLGIRMHFDSRKLQFEETTNVLSTNLITHGSPKSDVDNLDNDLNTDLFVEFRWSDIFASNWPGSLPQVLYTARFAAHDGFTSGTSAVSFTEIEAAPGFELDSHRTVIQPAPDEDRDGIDSNQENGAPNRGDGNGDGVADAAQPNVTSLADPTVRRYVTLASDEGRELLNVGVEQLPVDVPATIDLAGLFGFTLPVETPGGAAVVSVFVDSFSDASAPINTYYRFDAGANPGQRWERFIFDGETGAEFFSDRIVLHLVDGGHGDADGERNGVILSEGTPGVNRAERPWQNQTRAADVNDDGHVTPIDALAVISELKNRRSGVLTVPPIAPVLPFSRLYDVNGDNQRTPLDVLQIIAELRASGVNNGGDTSTSPPGEGEPAFVDADWHYMYPSPVRVHHASRIGPTASSIRSDQAAPASKTYPSTVRPSLSGRESAMSYATMESRTEHVSDDLELSIGEIADDLTRQWAGSSV